MRFIEKTSSPASLETWKTTRKNVGQSCTYGDLSGQPQNDLKAQLLTEQKNLCCYCQQKISNSSSTIEHFLPQSQFKLHEVDYLNLHLACNCSRGLKGEHRYCDVSKGNQLVVNAILHPECESFFRFANGEILPNDFTFKNFNEFKKNIAKLSVQNQAIVHMIAVLNLNSNDLVTKRKKTIKDLTKVIQSLDTVAKIDSYLTKEMAKENASRFPSLIKHYLILKRNKLN